MQLVLNVPLVISVSLFALASDKQWGGIPKNDWAWLVGAVAFFLLLLDVCLLNPLINRRRDLAAQVQQCFDCEVLELSWDQIRYGKAPDHETVEIWSKKYTHDPARDLKDWYRVEVAPLPHNIARIICQRANCWWDMDLRAKYNIAIIAIGVLMASALFIIGILLDCTIKTCFGLILAPLLPFAVTGIKLVQDNNAAIGRLKSMKEEIDSMWQQILQGTASQTTLCMFSEKIQAGIYDNRKNNPLIFDWVHRYRKPAHEETMSKSTQQYVAEFDRAHPLGYPHP